MVLVKGSLAPMPAIDTRKDVYASCAAKSPRGTIGY